jgi:hypothetical protein
MSALQKPPPINTDNKPADRRDAHCAQPSVRGEEATGSSTFKIPTTLFSDSPITPSAEYVRVVDPERKKLLFVLMLFVILTPLMFRYACGSSNNSVIDSRTIAWASDIDAWEWSVLIVLWVGILGSIMRLLPMVAGRPASVEASQNCSLDGVASLGLCSPFSSEDDAILLRSLLGRTCTVLHTVGSRHCMQGLYLDAILNERRIKGEANRRNCWIAWMRFLSALIDVSLLMKEEAAAVEHGHDEPPSPLPRDDLHCDSSDPGAPHRALYVQGIMGTHGVAASTPRMRQQPSRSVDDAITPRRVTFKDVGTVFTSTCNLSESQRNHVQDWGRDPAGSTPLSSSMASLSVSPASRRSGTAGSSERSYRTGAFPSEADGDSGGVHDRPMRKVLSLIPELVGEDEVSPVHSEKMPLVASVDVEDADDDSLQLLADIAPLGTSARAGSKRWSCEEKEFAYWFNIEREEGSVNGRDGFYLGGHSADVELSAISTGGSGSGMQNQVGATRSNEHLSGSIHSPTRSQQTLATPRSAASRVLNRFVSGLKIDTRRSRSQSSIDPIDMPAEAALPGRSRGASFAIAPTPQARAVTPRQTAIAASYLRPHGIPNLKLNMADIVPMINFLDEWLNEMKQREWTYDYHKPK